MADVLGLELETIMDIESDKVRIAFLAIGESKIELVEPTDETTGVARFLAARGEGFHHVCFEVANLAETLLKLEIAGLELIDTSPRRGAEGPSPYSPSVVPWRSRRADRGAGRAAGQPWHHAGSARPSGATRRHTSGAAIAARLKAINWL